jgi:hypothetical protein
LGANDEECAMVWDDGRSGVAGQFVGNLVLCSLNAELGKLRKRKGTVFDAPKTILIGRICSNTSYLSRDTAHWASISRTQHNQIIAEAHSEKKRAVYLFITANVRAPHVDFWLIPAAVLGKMLDRRHKTELGDVLAVQIKAAGDRYVLADLDVTEFHRSLELDNAQATELTAALDGPAPTAERRHRREQASRSAGYGADSYDVPVSDGRSVTLAVPGALAAEDVARLKGWLDLMADILTRPATDRHEPRRATRSAKAKAGFGFARERIWISDDFDAPLEDFKDYE